MENSTFEHAIFTDIDDFLEHCTKRLSNTALKVFVDLHTDVRGIVVTFAVDTSRQNPGQLYSSPNSDLVQNILSAPSKHLAPILEGLNGGIKSKKTGRTFYPAPPLVQVSLEQVKDDALLRGISIFYSEPIVHGSFVVFTSIWFKTEEYSQRFMLVSKNQGVRSLMDAVVKQFLTAAHIFMLQVLTPMGIMHPSPVNPQNIIRSAGQGLMARISFYLPEDSKSISDELDVMVHSSTLFDDVNAISKMPYEGSEAYGNLLVCPPNHPNIELLMEFTKPIWTNKHRQIRKLLEVARGKTYLLCHKGDVYGLGRICGEYDIGLENLFDIEVIEHAAWRLKHGEEILMVVKYDRPSLHVEPKETYLKRLTSALKAEFDQLDQATIQNLKSLVDMAMEQPHGTMLVITDHAQEEADRLANQSTHVTPTLIDSDLMKLISAIDGAILLDVTGCCYAIGVILDGIIESGEGDPARGARYHAALKYQRFAEERQHKCLIIVVSEDGMINIFPDSS